MVSKRKERGHANPKTVDGASPRLTRVRLFAGASLIAAAGLATNAVGAEVAASDTHAVSEVIVTARHRSEDVQKIPATVAVVSARDIKQTPTTSLDGLQQLVPGLTFSEPQFDKAQIYLRGVGSNQYSAGSEASVGVFVDGVYMARFSEMDVPLLDTQRVEVLKGPQGALYGRNTIGGAINVVTAEPTETPSGNAELTYGRFNQLDASAALSGPLAPNLLFRVSLSQVQDDGYMHILNMGGKTAGGGDNHFSARSKFLWRPTDRWDTELTLDYLNRHAQGEVDHLTNVGGQRGSPYLMLGPDLPTTLTNAYYSNNLYDARANTVGYQDQTDLGAALKVQYRGDAAAFTSITSVRHDQYRGLNDYDATEFDVLNFPRAENSAEISQEFRLNSVPGGVLTFNGRANWLFGLNFFHESINRTDTLAYGAEDLFAVLLNGGVPYQDNLRFSGRTDSYSAFGQFAFDLTQRLNLTLGGRYTVDDKVGLFDPTTGNPSPGGFVQANFSVTTRPPVYDSFDPSATLQYKLSDEAMVYASYTRGSKSGAFQYTVPTPAFASVNLMARPESVNAYEIGLKSQFLDRRLQFNASAFYMDYHDLQVQERVQVIPGNPASAATLLGNAQSSRIEGAELDLKFIPIDHLQFNLGYQYLDARYLTFHFDPTHDYSGNVMPRSPKDTVTASGLYSTPFASGTLEFYGAYQWYSSQFFESDNTDPGTKQGEYGLLSASTTFTKDRWRFSIWGQNLTNSHYILADVSNPPNPVDGTGKPAALAVLPGRPITYGVTLGARF